MIRVENIRDMTRENDVKRFLIDREWPKDVVRWIQHKEKSGMTRRALAPLEWPVELAPSPALWKWFRHDPGKIDQFRRRYFRELQWKKESWALILQESRKNKVALLYHGKHSDLTPAHFLKEFLDIQMEAQPAPRTARKKVLRLPGRGVAAPVEKSISRGRSRPLKEEMRFAPEQKMRFVPAEKRRVIR